MPELPDASGERLIEAVGRSPDGASVEQLEAITKIPRRTLQRRLAQLVRDGRLRATGLRRGRLYHVPDRIGDVPGVVAISKQGKLVQTSIRRPLGARTPVGYEPRFLEGYRPNVDAYLEPAMRARLHSIGRSPGSERPAGTYARQILSRLLVDLSWASSRLEGNTYTRLDTQNLIEFGRQAPGKDRRETQMILNHKAAIEMLVENADEVGFNRYTICNLHALLSDNLLPAEAAGRGRRIDVAISGTVYHPLAIPQRLDELFDLLLATATAIEDPFEQAFFIMVQLPYLQPFEDVNKRVSRLAANIPFIKHNLAPLSFVDVPDRDYVEGLLAVYEMNRIELARDVFLWAYERSCQRYTVVRNALPEPDPLRLRNREQLIAIVNAIVRDDLLIEEAAIRRLATPITTPDDLEQVIAMAIAELHALHEGALARFRLRLSEFRRWRGRST
ncbi:MAG TPA: Fic family protein [Kofleriaceae bacterium]|nr:Fic family protein [Kofleriaceae bacterium]